MMTVSYARSTAATSSARGLSSLLSCLLLTACILPVMPLTASAADTDAHTLPYTAAVPAGADYLYIVGGYHSIDNGCPAWGTADTRDSRMIGDSMGSVTVTYEDGSTADIPLIFGYTLWFRATWQEQSAPFKSGDRSYRDLVTTLKSTLSLKGAYEGQEACVLRVKLSGKPVRSVTLTDNPDKNGTPVVSCVLLASADAGTLTGGGISFSASDKFFETHTVDAADPLPDTVSASLDTLRHALMTFEEDWQSAPAFVYPADYTGSRVTFSGSPLADIATGSVYYNVQSILDRVDEDGMLHTSYKGAPSWRYDGFGYWVERADSYYDSYYSRDGGRAVMTLATYGHTDAAARAAAFANRQMMYFSDRGVTFCGTQVPGHYTVVVNKPMLYSTVLVPQAGWATKYTKAAFGEDYQNLGNQETDGQGLMMLANFSAWRALGYPVSWVEENWDCIREAPAWIDWCFDNPELSFAKDGLLYAESEAGMQQYTLYCNVPCMLGLYVYADMAKAAGHDAEAAAWKTRADAMKAAIETRFLRAKTGTWLSTGFGFFHDPVLTMLSDVFGPDPDAYPADFSGWVAASRKTYPSDVTSVSDYSWYGASGIGYNHSMITQNALLTDNMADASLLVENLCRISYSPRLPDSYIIPEGVTYDSETGALRRQGDLGNLVQAAEAMKVFDLVVGLDTPRDGNLRIAPRLPAGWSVNVTDRDLAGTDAAADMTVNYPADGLQTASLCLDNAQDIKTVSFRFGPLPLETQYAAVAVNGENVPSSFSLTGDSAWVNVTFAVESGKTYSLACIWSETLDTLGTFPCESETKAETEPAETAPVTETAMTDADTEADFTVPSLATDAGTDAAPAGCTSTAGLPALGLSMLLGAAALGIALSAHGKRRAARVSLAVTAAALAALLVGCQSPDSHENAAGTDTPAGVQTQPGTEADVQSGTLPETDTEPATLGLPQYIATAPERVTEASDPDAHGGAGIDPAALTDLVKNNAYAAVTASSTEGGNPQGPLSPGSAFDGDAGTRWSSEQHDVDGCWLCVDFGYPVRVGGLYVKEVTQWGHVSAWDAQYWSEAQQKWVTVLEEYCFTDGEFYTFDEPTEETYRFRLMFYESSSLAVSLWEVNLMGIFAEVPAGTEPRVPGGDTPGGAHDGVPGGLSDLAVSGTYTASSSEAAGTAAELGPAFCFDGKDNTRWSTVFHDLFESWIAVDFGREVTVYGFTVNEVTNWGHVTAYSAQVLRDGAWVTVYDGGELPSVPDTYIAFDAPAAGSGFRLLFHNGETLSETVTISEINVWGKE